MSQVIWVPGIGNTETFDGAAIPPGGHLVSSSNPSTPSTTKSDGLTVYAPAPYVGNAKPTAVPIVTNVPVQTSTWGDVAVTPYPTGGAVNPLALTAAQQRDKRQQEMNNNVWSNDTTVAALEKKAWAIYVDTGRWDSPEQKQYHDQAEEIRKGLNPLYPGTPWGQGENNYILPTDQFVTANGLDMKGMLTLGGMGLLAVTVLSMFRR